MICNAEQHAAPMLCKKCGGLPTVEAHLIPLGFTCWVKSGQKHMHALYKDGRGIPRVQSALFDKNILCTICTICDRKIGELDNYALKFCRGFETG